MKLLRERARIGAQIRQFFDARGFLEVQTPKLVRSPGLDLHLDAFEVSGGADPGNAPRWLSTSPEYQMKRLLAEGWTLIYELAACFRRGEFGAWHNPEFTMLEWYRAGQGVEDVMADTEQLLAAVTGGTVTLGLRHIEVRPPFERLTVCEAFQKFAGWSTDETLSLADTEPDQYFRVMVERVEPALEKLDHAVLLVDYPASQASLARRKPDDARFAERFELYVAGIELCNGFGELVDVSEQRARFERDQQLRKDTGLPVYPIDELFLEALARVPPSAGNALGFDRLVALACGAAGIGRVMAFRIDEL